MPGGGESGFDVAEASGRGHTWTRPRCSEPDPDRPERGGGLDVGLALVLGIELGEGELP